MAADDSDNGGQAEAAPRELGGEEWVEDPRLGGGIHAAAAIANVQFHVFRGGGFHADDGNADVVGKQRTAADGDRNLTRRSLRDRFRAIDHQVHEDLLKLSLIGAYQGQIVGQVKREIHQLGDAGSQQRGHLTDELCKVRRRGTGLVFSGVCQQPAGELGSPFAGRDDVAEHGCRA